MSRSQRSAGPSAADRAHEPRPGPEDWLVLTDADRVLAGMGAALDRTCRWQGDSD